MGIGIVSTKYGELKGVFKQSYTVFRGVPYAKPPVGGLRWKAPVEPDAWDGIRLANAFGNRCMQGVHQPGTLYQREFFNDEDFMPPMSEDSLYLNVWTPAETASEGLPVAFWIHGGAFSGGFGTEIEFDGEAFCRRGVILVTINYRLGALGFLAHPWLGAENSDGLSGNYGILDQIAALKWVRENISGFGGDPDKITIFGQSAGSMSVQTLVSSDLTRGMAVGAILQSGGGYKTGINRHITLEDAQGFGKAFADFCGVDSIEKLRSLSGEEVSAFSARYFAEGMKSGTGLRFAPCIDGFVLKHGFNEAVEKGFTHNIPYMIGSTSRDIGMTPEALEKGEKSALYHGCIGWSIENAKHGKKPSYVYYFDRAPLGDESGAFHSSELWYIFGTLSRSWRPKTREDYDLSERMGDYWCNFVKSGNPNGDGLPVWEPCEETERNVFTFK